jgi:ribosomal protein L29
MSPRVHPARPLTVAERQARLRQRKAEQAEATRKALEQILHNAKSIKEARAIAATALAQ